MLLVLLISVGCCVGCSSNPQRGPSTQSTQRFTHLKDDLMFDQQTGRQCSAKEADVGGMVSVFVPNEHAPGGDWEHIPSCQFLASPTKEQLKFWDDLQRQADAGCRASGKDHAVGVSIEMPHGTACE